MRALAVLLAFAACHPHTTPLPVPQLPGDGDANVAKPPPAQKVTVPDAWAGKTDLIAAPAAKPPGKLELPHLEELKLANGLQVYIVKSDRLPVVSVQLAIRAGRMHEPRARLGVAETTSDLIVKGTKRHDAVALAKAIDVVGGSISAESTFEATHLSCSVLARNLDTCLSLIPEMIVESTFPEDELAKAKDRLLGGVRQRLDDAGALASAHVQNLLWGDEHVRGWIDSEASIAGLRRDDVVAFHKTWYVPNNALLVVVGDVDAKKLKGDLERAFGGWKKAPLPPVPSYHEPGLSGIRIRLVDKPGQTRTQIRIGQFGIKHDDPRFFDTMVWNYVLGGGASSSRMMKIVRGEGDKSYGVSSSFDRNIDKGSFVVATLTRNADAIATAKLLVAEIAKMAKDGPTQDEVDAAVANLAGGYGLRFQGASDLGAQLLGAELHGFGTEYLSNYPLAVAKVDAGAAKQAAAEILDPRDYVIVLVGDAKDLEPQLKKEGWRYEKVAFTDPISPEVKEPEAPVDPKVLAAAKKLLGEALAAKGGPKVTGMKSFRWRATGSTTIGGQTIPVEVERVFELPDRMRIDATLSAQGKQVKVIVAVDGKTGWNQQVDDSGKSQVVDLRPEDFGAIDFERWREPELILVKANDPAAKIKPAPDDTIDGKPQAVIKLGSPFQGVDVTLFIDRKTKMVSRVAFSDGKQNQADDYSDYRDVQGVKVAHKRKSAAGQRLTQSELVEVHIDPKVDPAVFAKPAASK
jgi:zinc protease